MLAVHQEGAGMEVWVCGWVGGGSLACPAGVDKVSICTVATQWEGRL